MVDLARAISELKSLPDTALQKELASPTGAIPGYMVVGELHERKAMRARAGGKPDDIIKRKSMAEEYMGDIKSMMPQQQGMQPTQAMPQQAMPQPQTTPAAGGIASIPQPQGYAEGGIVDLQSHPANQSYPVSQPQAMVRRLIEDPEWAWVREAMVNKPARSTVPFPDEAPIPTARPLEPGMTYEDLIEVSRFAKGGVVSTLPANFRDRLIETATSLGISPQDLATVISYETGGTFNPTVTGPTTKWGTHRGLIQFGEPQARQYGVDWSDPVNSQLGAEGAVANYLRGAGVKPGMGIMDVYSAINAGAPGRYGASDAAAGGAPGTVADKVNYQMAGHRANAVNLLGGQIDPTAAAGAGVADASGVVAAQAADTASQMAAAEAAAVDPMSVMGDYAAAMQMLNPPKVTAAPQPAPTLQRAQQQAPVDYMALAEETSLRPRRRRENG